MRSFAIAGRLLQLWPVGSAPRHEDCEPIADALRNYACAIEGGDAAAVLAWLHGDFHVVTIDGHVLSRAQVERRLRSRLSHKCAHGTSAQTLHLDVRGKTACQIILASGKVVRAQRGSQVATTERVMLRATWIRSTSGWRMLKAEVIRHERDQERLPLPTDSTSDDGAVQKYVD